MKSIKILKKNYEFRRVLTKGKYYTGKNLEAFVNKNNKKITFLGIAISSKISKAVERNKVKRLIKDNFKIMEDNILQGYDIVFLWKKSVKISEARFENVKEDIEKILKTAKMLKDI